MRMFRRIGMIAAGVFVSATIAMGQTRSITITITIASEAGSPVSGIPVGVYVDSIGDKNFGTTDSNGEIEIACAVSLNATKAYVGVTIAAAGTGGQTFQEVRAAAKAAKERIDAHFYPSYWTLPLDPQVDQYTLQIVAKDAIKISGRLVDGSGAGQVAAAVVLRGSDAYGVGQRDDPAGTFLLPGVDKDAPAELFVFSNDGTVVKSILLDSTQTAADVDLGDVVINPLVGLGGDATLALTATHQAEVADVVEPTDRCVTLISDNAATILVFPTDGNGSVQRNTASASGEVVVPAGRYFVAPGSIWGVCGTRLLDLIRAGQVDLEAAGVPVVEAVSGTTVTQSINMAEAKSAILQAGG